MIDWRMLPFLRLQVSHLDKHEWAGRGKIFDLSFRNSKHMWDAFSVVIIQQIFLNSDGDIN